MKPVLVFDLDDTLYPEHQFVISGFQAVDVWIREAYGFKGFAAVAQALFDDGLRGRIFDEALAQLGWTKSAIEVRDLVSIYREHSPEIVLHDDARWALGRFQDSHRLALVTDGYLSTQRQKVLALGIGSVFETIVYSDEFGREQWKPSPVPYQAILDRLGCDGIDCTYVSDNPRKDFVSANALGWNTIRIRREDGIYRDAVGEGDFAPRHEIASLYGLEAMLVSAGK